MNTMHNEFKTLSRLVKSTDLGDSDLNSRFVLDLEMDSVVPFSFLLFCFVLSAQGIYFLINVGVRASLCAFRLISQTLKLTTM